jgi:hypothetical protein
MFDRLTLSRRNRSGFRGVSFEAHARKWRARIYVRGRKIHLGYFSDKRDAAVAYQASVKHYAQKLALPAGAQAIGTGRCTLPSSAGATLRGG